MSEEHTVKHNELSHAFEVTQDGQLAVLEYYRQDDAIIFTHTGVPEELEGQGVGSALTRTGLDYARAQNLRVVPQCPFVRGYLERHPEYQDLVRSS